MACQRPNGGVSASLSIWTSDSEHSVKHSNGESRFGHRIHLDYLKLWFALGHFGISLWQFVYKQFALISD